MCTLWALDTVHQVLIAHALYILFVKGIVNPILLIRVEKWVLAQEWLEDLLDRLLFPQTYDRHLRFDSFHRWHGAGLVHAACLVPYVL